ncbi:GNAT family N-acetyltransferase [Dictyobacter aurantiacus]|uniref:N-acetyltransferase domain-containing protein n=1 Tax=Dictyobacter aurantiacus TaxID=1936993 RepID=A0A401ZK33_9CHLR|nr:hypothetical protein [Dictyobacter aurantiacus]GCE07213.1 hypothetical protein KDAU_45420 [Dictyobacter aurantiacus]
MAFLSPPSDRYRESFLQALQEFQDEGRTGRVLLTCDEDNIGSRKIIEASGGVLEEITEVEGWPAKVCCYWIQL